MPKSPYVNALLAGAYIVGIVYLIQAFTSILALQKTLIIPIGMLSLFVLSAATMALLFGYQPFKLYFEGKKEEALAYFFKTLLAFAVLVAAYVLVVFLVAR